MLPRKAAKQCKVNLSSFLLATRRKAHMHVRRTCHSRAQANQKKKKKKKSSLLTRQPRWLCCVICGLGSLVRVARSVDQEDRVVARRRGKAAASRQAHAVPVALDCTARRPHSTAVPRTLRKAVGPSETG